MSAPALDQHPVVRWLMTDGRRLTEPNAFLDAFAATLLAAGVDVARVTTSVPILHPQIFFSIALGFPLSQECAELN
jgi:adenylate cyclase